MNGNSKATSGVVNLHKPSGMTSRQAVDCVKRLLRPAKTGHAGTLDPLASGVLVVCVGAATRLVAYVQAMPKRYRGTFLLGRESDTEDIEGEVRLVSNGCQPTEAEIRAAAARFVGEIEQRPPAYSALKVSGRRAYELARAGKPVELAPRPIVVHRIDVVRYTFPELVLDVECGSGTYLRSLGRDIAEAVGTAAVMSSLVRTAIGGFRLEDARLPDQLTCEAPDEWLRPPLSAVQQLAKVTLTDQEIGRVRRGLAIPDPRSSIGVEAIEREEIAAVDDCNSLVAILVGQRDRTLRPVLNLANR
ncbi:MAG TPA: tRNA pseudouridine(55) synthase TruB [Pirellulales bacterium]|jgi:tRNA pseudouridine55 synthase|nr:tRNA pseudouridine(55) synthase TruB [Pirellulales bacterium]